MMVAASSGSRWRSTKVRTRKGMKGAAAAIGIGAFGLEHTLWTRELAGTDNERSLHFVFLLRRSDERA